MATKAKSSSAPSTPRFAAGATAAKQQVSASPDINPATPNYLKPTISWCNIACKHLQKHHPDAPAPNKQQLRRRRSIDKIPSPVAHPLKAPCPKTLKNGNTTQLVKSKSIPKSSATGVVKKREAKETSNGATMDVKGKQDKKKGLGDNGEHIDLLPVQAQVADELVNSNESKSPSAAESSPTKKGHEAAPEDPTSPGGNEVVEERAKKLAERRNKVKALVGAFETVTSLQKSPEHGQETVVSLQEPESQTNGQHGQESIEEESQHSQQEVVNEAEEEGHGDGQPPQEETSNDGVKRVNSNGSIA